MYVILPFAYFAVRRDRHGSLALWLLSFVPVFVFTNIALQRPFQILMFAPCFAAGILAFDLARNPKPIFRMPAWVWPVGILALLALFRPYDPAGFSEKYAQCWGLALGIGLLFPFVKEARENWFYKGCNWIAERSYGIYLSHSVVLWIVFNRMRLLPLSLRVLVLISGVLGVPALLYVGLERPLVRVGMNIAKKYLGRSRAQVVEAVI